MIQNINSESLLLLNINDHIEVIKSLCRIEFQISSTISACINSLKFGGKIIFCGNGGSAADSQHLAAEFIGRFNKDRPPIAALALSTDTSAITCISNDYSFNEIFSRQILALGNSGDCLVAISTSGNSDNVIKAVLAAKAKNIFTIGLLGKNGGELKELCDLSIVVESSDTARIQEAHILIGHTICEGVEIGLGFISQI
jgi:D-sedoheptulose 7-phosphate isomerase